MAIIQSVLDLLATKGYKFVQKLGGGYHGSVLRVYDLEWQKDVALKIVRTSGENAEAHQRLHLEYEILKTSDAEVNLLQVYKYDRGKREGHFHSWFTMELCEASLNSLLPEMELKQRARCAWECLRGLAYLHQKGVSHRDIKPSNLLLDSRMRLKIGDFGTVKIVRRPPMERGIGELYLIGTVPYVAPELWATLEHNEIPGNHIWLASDQYAAGMTCYEILTGGRLPPKIEAARHENDINDIGNIAHRFRKLMKDKTEIFQPIELKYHRGPLQVNEVLRRMLDVNWRRRFSNMPECLLAFVHALMYDGLLAVS